MTIVTKSKGSRKRPVRRRMRVSGRAKPRVEPRTPQPGSGVDQRMAQIREANEHLVVAAVRAQTLTEEAESASHLKDEFLAT
ncbi:MAG: hypothetical protein EHM50_10715, partial [Lysobacterales bacterium]